MNTAVVTRLFDVWAYVNSVKTHLGVVKASNMTAASHKAHFMFRAHGACWVTERD